ncbi:MAG TPA: hypothetical protein PLK12_04030 [Prolixibacteraceae bacterium]|nr:hypothetical protein [Prolixibacteraceae bacterium]
MHTTFHLNSAQDISSDLLDAIKAAYKTKPITIIVEEEEEITQEMKSILDSRLQEDESTYISSSRSIEMLKKNYGL